MRRRAVRPAARTAPQPGQTSGSSDGGSQALLRRCRTAAGGGHRPMVPPLPRSAFGTEGRDARAAFCTGAGWGARRWGSHARMSAARIAVLDVDGTLVDTNYQHALAWYRAFRSLGETFPIWRIHRLIGMGGDQLVAALGGDDVEERIGDAARERWVQEADPMMARDGAAARRPGADRGAQGARAPGGAGQLRQAAPRRAGAGPARRPGPRRRLDDQRGRRGDQAGARTCCRSR